jgi:hypothetical protein
MENRWWHFVALSRRQTEAWQANLSVLEVSNRGVMHTFVSTKGSVCTVCMEGRLSVNCARKGRFLVIRLESVGGDIGATSQDRDFSGLGQPFTLKHQSPLWLSPFLVASVRLYSLWVAV